MSRTTEQRDGDGGGGTGEEVKERGQSRLTGVPLAGEWSGVGGGEEEGQLHKLRFAIVHLPSYKYVLPRCRHMGNVEARQDRRWQRDAEAMGERRGGGGVGRTCASPAPYIHASRSGARYGPQHTNAQNGGQWGIRQRG